MDKITFLAVLAEKLAALSLPEEEVQRQINHMQRYLSSISDEDFAAENPSIEDAQKIADNLFVKYEKEHFSSVESILDAHSDDKDTDSEKEEKQNGDLPDEAAFAAAEAEIDAKAARKAAKEAKKNAKNEQGEDFLEELATEQEEQRRAEEIKQVAIERAIADGAIPENAVVEGGVIVTPDDDPIEDTVDPSARPDVVFEEFDKIAKEKNRKKRQVEEVYEEDEDYDGDDEDEKPKKVREKVKGSPLFWILFIITLPITLPILAVICVFFGSLYVAITVGLVALTLLLIACVAVGTALSLIGIIYGATQTVKSLPIGLTEIGIGIAIGGMTMLLGVLLYNFSIRIYPKLYKLLSRGAGFIFSKIGDLYYNCKKGCAR